MALNPTKTASNPRIAKLIELEVSGRIKPEHKQELDTYRAQGLAPPAAGSDLTETQSKNTGFYARALEADTNFSKTKSASDPYNAFEAGLVNTLPTAVTNSFISDDRQLSEQAKRNFIAATLRAESGAAIGENEYINQAKVFFPQPGDGPEVIAQKARDRQVAVNALRTSAGEGASQLGRIMQPEGEARLGFDKPAEVSNARNLTPAQQAELEQLAQSGASADVVQAAYRGYGLTLPREQAEQGAKFYADPKNRRIRPTVQVDNSVPAVRPEGNANTVGAFARGGFNTLSLGLGNRVSALSDTVTDGGTYAQNLDRYRGYDAYDEQNNGGARLAGQVVGGLALPVIGGEATAANLARTGAIYGGASGFNNSYGGVGDRLASGGLNALAGAGLGYGLGRAAQFVGNRTPPPTGGNPLLEAAGRQGVDILPADVGGPMTRRLTAAAAQGPLSAGPIIRGGQRAAEQMMGARDRIAATVGNAVDPVEAGEAVAGAARGFAGRTSVRGGSLYDEAAQLAGDARVDPAQARQTLSEQIARMEQVPGGGAGLEQARNLLTNLEGNFSVQGIRDMRTEMFVAPELRGTPASSRLRQIVDAAADDVANSLEAQGRGEAAAAFRRADRYWRARIETIDQTIEPIIGSATAPKSGEQVVQSLMTAGRSNGARLQRFVQSLPADEQATLRSTVIAQLGRSSAGTQNAEGTAFSPNQFLTHWNNLTPRAKDVLFRGEARDALNDLARIAAGSREAQGYANRSNTGGAVLGNIGALFGIGSVSPTVAVAGGAGQLISGRLLASPAFARWLGRPANTAQQVASATRRLAAIASREPQIANDILPIQRALQESIPRAAAQGQNEQNRR